MFKFTYKFTVNPINQTITLSPTKSMWIKALAPSLILGVGFMVAGFVMEAMENQETENQTDLETY